MRRLLALPLVAVALAACSVSTTGAAPTDEAPVVRGREARAGEFPSVVHLGRKDARGTIKFGCTGTMVTERHVLTAAHCIEHVPERRECLRPPPGPGGGDIFLSEVEYDPAASFVVKHPTIAGRRVAVTRHWAHPRFRDDLIGWADAALLELAEPIDVPRVPLLTDLGELRAATRPGKTAVLVGYGKTELFDLDADARKAHVGEVPIARANAAEVDLGGGPPTGAAASPGDSGGPAFVRLPSGDLRQLGITSRGPENFTHTDQPAVYGVTRYVACDLMRASGVAFAPELDCRDPGDAATTPAAIAALDFKAICDDPAATASQKRTVRGLKLVVAEKTSAREDAVTCAVADAFLRDARELDLASMDIRDVGPLASLPKLEKLVLDYDDVRDLAPLARVATLRVLRVGWNDVRSFAPLAAREAAGLRVLGKAMQRGTYRDTAFLRLCKDPRKTPEQSVAVGAVERFFWHPSEPPATSDACALANRELVVTRSLRVASPKWKVTDRVTCEVEATFPAQAVRDLTPLAGLLALESLDLSSDEDAPNDVRDLAPLATLENLRALDLTGNAAPDVAPLAPLVRDGLVIKRTP